MKLSMRLCFNPRARVGRDIDAQAAPELRLKVSIHAPAWGATLALYFIKAGTEVFQSTRPRGARRHTGH